MPLYEKGYVPLSQTGSELLFDIFSRRYENSATIVTSNLPFQEWTSVFASERLTGALLDRITHHVHILEMNGESYRLKQSRSRRGPPPNNPLAPIDHRSLPWTMGTSYRQARCTFLRRRMKLSGPRDPLQPDWARKRLAKWTGGRVCTNTFGR